MGSFKAEKLRAMKINKQKKSRLSNGRQSSPATDMYDEYLERSRSLRRQRPVLSKSTEEKKEDMRNMPAPAAILDEAKEDNATRIEEVEESKEDKHDDEEEFEECEAHTVFEEEKCEEKQEEEEEIQEEKGEEKREAEAGMPAEELNKRIEDFIARVNRQRWLEARYLVCCKA